MELLMDDPPLFFHVEHTKSSLEDDHLAMFIIWMQIIFTESWENSLSIGCQKSQAPKPAGFFLVASCGCWSPALGSFCNPQLLTGQIIDLDSSWFTKQHGVPPLRGTPTGPKPGRLRPTSPFCAQCLRWDVDHWRLWRASCNTWTSSWLRRMNGLWVHTTFSNIQHPLNPANPIRMKHPRHHGGRREFTDIDLLDRWIMRFSRRPQLHTRWGELLLVPQTTPGFGTYHRPMKHPDLKSNVSQSNFRVLNVQNQWVKSWRFLLMLTETPDVGTGTIASKRSKSWPSSNKTPAEVLVYQRVTKKTSSIARLAKLFSFCERIPVLLGFYRFLLDMLAAMRTQTVNSIWHSKLGMDKSWVMFPCQKVHQLPPLVHRRSDLSEFIPHGPMIYSVPEATIPLGIP